ncbi:hypothetical protein BCV71DRAFT_238417 [Rhizopus microsporus]|uniref:Uncharacterized protein n=1 Tax=Rhizopus microsporus TaxID=58291 RepID=A0A1X0RR52_RHIZD|nr:hypothetical protein BCV71DRAFT_238417 [Rhizopus microsporus]
MITPGVYLVQLFSNIKLQHEVTVLKSEMKSCACNDFRCNNIALHSIGQVDTVNTATENRVAATEHSSMFQDNLTTKIANLLAAYRSYRENLYRLTDEQIANIRLDTELILPAIDENNNKRNNATKTKITQSKDNDLFFFSIIFKVPLRSEGLMTYYFKNKSGS